MSADSWLTQRERGTLWLMQLTFRLAMLLGRRPMRPLVLAIAMYYRLFDRRAVRASAQWLRMVHGTVPGFWAVYRHIRTFAQVTLDRVFLLTGRTAGLTFTRTGYEHLEAQQRSGRGAVLLGAHLGSFEAMRARGDAEALRIRILGHFANARMINALLKSLHLDIAASVIHIGDDPVGTMASVRACVEAGHFIAILGDRVGLNERTVEASFFGEPARFPAGPFLLASVLHCPIYLVFGIYREPGRYELTCEPFAERLDIPRGNRQAALQDVVRRYAQRLEHHCRRAPDNWFNFYDLWSRP